ncbi:MAG: BA14K family protein [Rhizobiaceae bacterium]|nr:BA14K family protein [Rhizobiaceae bacterium]
MPRIISVLCAAAMTFANVGVMSAPSFAGPTSLEIQRAPSSLFEPVQYRNLNDKNDRRNNRVKRGGTRNDAERRANSNRFERRGNRAYYNGHRGYNTPRRGYRQHNGYWFPGAAFITGAIIGGIISNQNTQHGSSHVRWCHDHYRSYRVSDNTFQPYHGPRKQCRSPY